MSKDMRVYLLIGVILVVLGATAVLTYLYINNRLEYPWGTTVINVEDQEVKVIADPNKKLVRMDVGQEEKAAEVTGTGGAETAVSEPAAAEAAEVEAAQAPPVTATPVVTSTPVPSIGDYLFVSYTVVAGDTLYSIANNPAFNTTIPLMARFGIDATQIYAGNVIQIPVANPAVCPGNFAYVVREGDTLSSIAISCNTTVDNLKAINGISGDDYRLDETSVLCIPNPPT